MILVVLVRFWRNGGRGDFREYCGAGEPGDPAVVGRAGADSGAAAASRHQCVLGDGDDAVRGAHLHVRGHDIREAVEADAGIGVQVSADQG